MTTSPSPALVEAIASVGLNATGAVPIRLTENEVWRLPGRVVVRVSGVGQWHAAVREVRVARWLADQRVPVVEPLGGVPQPVEADGRPVTFWRELPRHEPGDVLDVAEALKRLHGLPFPPFPLGRLAPFVRLAERIDAAVTLPDDDRRWLRGLLRDVARAWDELPDGLPHRVVHGDAWGGNVVRAVDGEVLLLDLERCAIGPPEWDLASTAVKFTSTGAFTAAEYAAFCTAYGVDVTAWAGYPTLRAIRELRMTTYAARHAATHPAWVREARHRVDCLRGRAGARPWYWAGIM